MNIAQNLISFLSFRGSKSEYPGTTVTSGADLIEKSKYKTQFTWFYFKECRFCKEVREDWAKLQKRSRDSTDFCCQSIDCKQDPSVAKSFKEHIVTYPTFLLFKNGKMVKKYNGTRKASDMYKFASQ